jgi:sialate O-acetylesterase
MPRQALTDCGITKEETIPIGYDGQPKSEKLSATNTELYNSMIYPFTRMVVTGAIWYQGESNSGYNRDKYTCTFSKMIQYWRQVWNTRTNGITNQNFPFGFVQLSTNRNSTSFIGGFPWIRWYQTFGVGYVPNSVVANVFMAAAMDLRDDPGNIHPRTKTDVGYRLSRSGLAVAYSQNVEYLGPLVSNVVVGSGSSTIDVTYSNVTGIEFRNSEGFEVCCQGTQCTNDNIWLAAPAALKSSLSITLTVPSSCVSRPIYGVRYLWRETPCEFKQAAIYSSTDSNLPSPPYLKVF